MKCVKFDGCNTVIAEGQDEYETVQGYRSPSDPQGVLVMCFELTFMERLRLLFSGMIWHQVMTFNQPLQPFLINTSMPDWLAAEVDTFTVTERQRAKDQASWDADIYRD